ncbi:hypothetical protein [Corynebacterium sp. 335C]
MTDSTQQSPVAKLFADASDLAAGGRLWEAADLLMAGFADLGDAEDAPAVDGLGRPIRGSAPNIMDKAADYLEFLDQLESVREASARDDATPSGADADTAVAAAGGAPVGAGGPAGAGADAADADPAAGAAAAAADLDELPPSPPRHLRWAQWHTLNGLAEIRREHHGRAVDHLELASGLFESHGLTAQALPLVGRIVECQLAVDDVPRAEEALHRARALAGRDPEAGARWKRALDELGRDVAARL